MLNKKQWTKVIFGVGLLLTLSVVSVLAASPFFVEPEVEVLYTFDGTNGSGNFGWVAADLADITGDGVNDMIITALTESTAVALGGKAYVYSGADGALLHVVEGTEPFELLGHSATSAGDVNNDGIPDYITGSPGLDAFGGGAGFTGKAHVWSGADHTLMLEFSGGAGEAFGASVAGAGDVNGDGHDDVIVGATFAANSAGRISVYSGLDGSLLWAVDGDKAGDHLGSAVGVIGDVTGDGIPDQVAGAHFAGEKGRGEAYGFSGADGTKLYTMKPVGLPGSFPSFAIYHSSGAGDVNNDGVPDIYIGDYNAKRGNTDGTGRAYVFSGADGKKLYNFDAENNGDGLGPGRGIGDVNGDGYGDLYVAAYTYSTEQDSAGKGYVYSGKDGTVLRVMTGAVANVSLGVDALAVGDLNGDGLTDYMLTGVGVAHVIAGTPLD